MRRNPTASEYALWQRLRAKKLHGITFRRQQVVGRRIVDFLAPTLKLVVEVQGGYHALTASADAKRCAQLKRAGYTVVYVSASLVLEQPEVAVETVRVAVLKLLG
jgi:very-short-patch-repair endonuclease